jgi:hypothetical protein
MLTGSPFLLLLLSSILAFADTGSPDPPDDDDDSEGDGEQNGDGGNAEEEEEIRDPQAKIKALEEQVGRLSKKLKSKDEHIEQLEAGGNQSAELTASRLEAAFYRTLLFREEPIADVEAAWDLASAKGYLDTVKIEDANVEGMEEALDRLVSRYPYLVDEKEDEEDEEAPKSGGRPVATSARRRKETGAATLAERFPALRGRRRIR